MAAPMRKLAALLLACAAIPALAQTSTSSGDPGLQPTAEDLMVREGRPILAREYPEVIAHVYRNDGFGGAKSAVIAPAMLSDSPASVAAARAGMTVERHGQRMWLLRFPYVNVAVVETRRGLVVFDTGYAAIGPVLADVLPTLSRKPVTHIVVSHVHIDHAYGWPALKVKWPHALTITSDLFPEMAAKEVRLSGSIGRFNNQKPELQPTRINRLPSPDITFRDSLTLTIDGERFEFNHHPGETEEHIWMYLPSRSAIFTGDYFQGFLPNAGNGKRIMRHVDEWAVALRAMVARKPQHMLPMHDAAIDSEGEIARRLTLIADAFDYISNQVVARLNAGERKDVIAATIDWPERFARAPELDPQYNRPTDIARMVERRWTGWWDDIPSHFPAMRFEAEAQEAIRLAGGLDAIDKRARELLKSDTAMASRLADWAYYGAPDDPRAMRLAVDVYMARMAEPGMPLQESQVYFDHAAKARVKLKALTGK